MEATRIIAVRHGETAWNVDARIQGQLDIQLNDTGRWQARRVGEALSGEELAAIYSSDLGRAHETARAISDVAGIPVVAHSGLRERRFGLFEGKTFHEIHETWPEDALNWKKRIPEWAPPEGGESLLQLRERVTRTVSDLASRHTGQLIAVVAHGGVLDALYRFVTGMPLERLRDFPIYNASLNWVRFSAGKWALDRWGDISHLTRDAALDDF